MLRVYHTSDLHDHRGIVPRLRALRGESPGLLFDCGDSLRGSQTMYFRSEPIIDELDAAGYDAQGFLSGTRSNILVPAAPNYRWAGMVSPSLLG